MDLRIVNIIQRYPPAVGGSEAWCREACQYLSRRGHHIRVLTMNVDHEEDFWKPAALLPNYRPFAQQAYDGEVFVRRYRRSAPNFILHHLVFKRILDWKFGILFYGPHSGEMYRKLYPHVRWADVVVLHTVPFPHNYVGYLYARLLGKPVVAVPHFHPGHPEYERASNYWLLSHCDGVLADTQFERSHFVERGLPPDRVYLGGVGINPEDYVAKPSEEWRCKLEGKWGVDDDDKVIVFLGRKLENKGIQTLIEAVKKLEPEMRVKLILAGPSFDWFTTLYGGLSTSEKSFIIDAGVLTHQEKVNLLHNAAVVVLPSRFESFGIAFLEAWACGAPVVGTTEGAMHEVIGDGGLIFPYGDSGALYRCLKELLLSPETARRIGSQGNERLNRYFLWEIVGRRIENAIEKVMGATAVEREEQGINDHD